MTANKGLIRYLKYTCSDFLYLVGISPANTAAALAAIRLLRQESERVSNLQNNALRLRSMFKEQGGMWESIVLEHL